MIELAPHSGDSECSIIDRLLAGLEGISSDGLKSLIREKQVRR